LPLFLHQGCAPHPESAGSTNPRGPVLFADVKSYFASRPGGVITLPAQTPGKAYRYDPAEKDVAHGDTLAGLRFTRIEVRLAEEQPVGKVIGEFRFFDGKGSVLILDQVNLLDLVPQVAMSGALQYPDILLKEFERYGIIYYKKENEFTLTAKDPQLTERAYQVGLFNNCLEAGRWEMALSTQYYRDYEPTHASPRQFQRYRILAHTWFQFDKDLYALLLRLANPEIAVDPFLSYDEMTKRAEEVRIPFESFGRIQRPLHTEMLEVGHKSKRELHELDEEENQKYWHGLVLNRNRFHTYDDVLNTPVWLAKFAKEGFYDPNDSVNFDYGWMRRWDKVEMAVVDTGDGERYVQLKISGDESPYLAVLGNFDIARLNSGKPVNMPFGDNPQPKSRLHRKGNFNTAYNLGPKGKGINPYFFLVDKKTGKFINNQKLGLEQMFLSWQSAKRDALVLYFVSYERMLPIWMARVGLDREESLRDRIANAMYHAGDTSAYLDTGYVEIRKSRDSLRSVRASVTENDRRADTAVLDFEAYGHPGNRLHSLGYTLDEKGFTLTSGGFLTAKPFRTIGARGFPYTGSAALINGGKTGVNYVARRLERVPDFLDYDEKRRFDALSVCLAPFAPGAATEVTFVGVKKDSSTVTETFVVPGEPVLRPYRFGPAFKEIYSLRWLSQSLQFDDLVLVRTWR